MKAGSPYGIALAVAIVSLRALDLADITRCGHDCHAIIQWAVFVLGSIAATLAGPALTSSVTRE